MKTMLTRRGILTVPLIFSLLAALGSGPPKKISDLPKDAKWGESVMGCKLGCAPTTQPYKTGEPIDINVRIGNFGTVNQNVPFDHGLFWCNFKVTDKDGKEIPLTRNGLPNNGDNPNIGFGPVEPGFYFHRTFRLNEIFDFSVPGDYKVAINMDVYDDDLHPHRVSHTIHVKVEDSYVNWGDHDRD